MFYILALILLVIGGFVSGFLLGTLYGIHKEQDNRINRNQRYYDTELMAQVFNNQKNQEMMRNTIIKSGPIEHSTDVVEDAINSFKEEFQKEGIK